MTGVPVTGVSAQVPLLPDPDHPPTTPHPVLETWLPPDDAPDRPLCTLATVDDRGRPDARTLVLSGRDRQGLTVHTARGSRKTDQLAAVPWATAVLALPEQARQLVVSGPVEVLTDEESRAAYLRRPRYLQLLAWLNTTGMAQLPLAERTRIWTDFDRTHPTLEPPAGWVGYRVRYDRVVFWQGSTDAPSIRLAYERDGEDWAVSRLPG